MKTQMIMRWIAWSTIGISLLLYVLACALPSGVIAGIDPEDEVQGFWCLAGGWTAVFASIVGLSKHPLFAIWNVFVSLFLWGSNILYFWAIIDTLRAKVRKRTVWLTILAFSASLCYFLYPIYHLESLRLGNYLWAASYLVMLIGVVILWWNNYNIGASPKFSSPTITDGELDVEAFIVDKREYGNE